MNGLVVDIETIPNPKFLAREIDEVSLNKGIGSNWKDPDKIAGKQAGNRKEWEAEKIKQGSLRWELGEIVSIGVQRVGYEPVVGMNVPEVGTTGLGVVFQQERFLLEWYWELRLEYPGPIIGFNIHTFDLPWLIKRGSVVHGIDVGHAQFSPWDHGFSVDLMTLLGGKEWRSLEYYADVFDLPHKPVGSGSEIYEWYKNGEYDKIYEHQVNDVLCEYELYEKCKGLI